MRSTNQRLGMSHIGLISILLLAACSAVSPITLPTLVPTAIPITPTTVILASAQPSPSPLSPTLSPLPSHVTSDDALPAATPTLVMPTPQMYIVQEGDNLWVIAASLGLKSLEPLLAVNPDITQESLLSPGQALLIPATSTEVDEQTVEIPRHRVKPGDTLWTIADSYHISYDSLMQINPGIDPDNLQQGEEILIPVSLGDMYYTVLGDTLSQISLDFDVSIDDLMQANPTVLNFENPDSLLAGVWLRIPQDSNIAQGYDCTPLPEERSVVQSHTVANGEQPRCIAYKFSISIATLLNANPIISQRGELEDGDIVLIPPTDGALYVVTTEDIERGVTLDDVAQWYYGTADKTLLDWNGQLLNAPVLSAGTQIFIPHTETLIYPFNSAQLLPLPLALPGSGGVIIDSDLEPGLAVSDAANNSPAPDSPLATDLTFRIWYDKYAADDPGYCPLLDGFGWMNALAWPITSRQIRRHFEPGHPAIDILADAGTLVSAAETGVVVWSGYSSFGGGLRVILAHGNGWLSQYLHLSESSVVCGQSVNRGQAIGSSGKTGTSFEHLHFQVQQGSVLYDPERWLK